MPINKDLKRLVRTRMRKTGEAYSAARAQLIRHSTDRHISTFAVDRPISKSAVAAPLPESFTLPTPKHFAALAGVSDDAIRQKTGCTWERWVFALDRKGAERMAHRDIAALVREKYKIAAWWSQTIAVGYERIKGLRAIGQRRDGTYEATKSRTFNVSASTLFSAWADARTRRRWLDGTSVKVRTATASKSMRLEWAGGAIIAVGFMAKGRAKSSVAVAHTKLPDRETADRLKRYWSERLDALGKVLTE